MSWFSETVVNFKGTTRNSGRVGNCSLHEISSDLLSDPNNDPNNPRCCAKCMVQYKYMEEH